MTDSLSEVLIATALLAAGVRVATHGLSRWRVVSALAFATILVTLAALLVHALDAAGWFWFLNGGELGHPPPSPT